MENSEKTTQQANQEAEKLVSLNEDSNSHAHENKSFEKLMNEQKALNSEELKK